MNLTDRKAILFTLRRAIMAMTAGRWLKIMKPISSDEKKT